MLPSMLEEVFTLNTALKYTSFILTSCTVFDYSMHFLGNSAELGEALYVADNTNFGTCVKSAFESSECFLQILAAREERVEKKLPV